MSTKLQKELGVTHPRKGPEDEGGERFLRRLADYVRENITPEDQAEFGFHKTALVSIFDHKEYDVDALAGKGKNKSSAGEVQARKILQKLVKNKKGLELKEQVYIQTVLKQLGRTVKGLPHGDIFEEYLNHKASFDFVLYQGGTPFLAVEVDGAYHRFPLIKNMSPDEPEKSEEEQYQAFRRRWLLDRQKDALVREALDGQVFYGNTRRYVDEWRADEARQEIDQWGQPIGAFALLRLPDDGTTYLETDALQKTAPQEVKEKVFTLEELIERCQPTTRAQKQK